MKAPLLFVAIFALAMLIIPMIAMNFDMANPVSGQTPVHVPAAQADAALPAASSIPERKQEAPAVEAKENDSLTARSGVAGTGSFRILNETTGAVEEVPLRDFVRGAVAAEMPATFHTEALKAQAVAAHTFALNCRMTQEQNPDPALKGADFAADPINRQIYITESQARNFYGDTFDIYWPKVCDAADAVISYVLEYDGEPILAAYHAMSAGMTEDAGNVWIGSAPYLVPVDSEGDFYAPDYHTSLVISKEDTAEILASNFAGFDPDDDPEDWFTGIRRSGSGYITEVSIGTEQYHGKDIRSAFGLRSHNVDIDYEDGQFTFDVFGYGHGVGLSQYGADFMARQGATFDEILANYYVDSTLTSIDGGASPLS